MWLIKKEKQVSNRALCSVTYLLFMLFFCQLTSPAFGQKYDLNDPRNPDCPCHKMQEQADEEFKLLNKKVDEKIITLSKDFVQNKNTDQVIGNPIKDSNRPLVERERRSTKKKRTLLNKMVFKFSNKYRFKKQKKINVAICYKWTN